MVLEEKFPLSPEIFKKSLLTIRRLICQKVFTSYFFDRPNEERERNKIEKERDVFAIRVDLISFFFPIFNNLLLHPFAAKTATKAKLLHRHRRQHFTSSAIISLNCFCLCDRVKQVFVPWKTSTKEKKLNFIVIFLPKHKKNKKVRWSGIEKELFSRRNGINEG